MREHKNWRVIRRIIAPPSFPRIAFPPTTNRAEHVAAEDPGSDIFERLRSKIVVDALGSIALTKCFRALKPGVQLEAANSKWIVAVLARSSSETAQRNGECSDSSLAYVVLLGSSERYIFTTSLRASG